MDQVKSDPLSLTGSCLEHVPARLAIALFRLTSHQILRQRPKIGFAEPPPAKQQSDAISRVSDIVERVPGEQR